MRFLLLTLILLAGNVHAEVYKCVSGGKTSYTDKPCDAAAQPAVLPSLSTVQHGAADDLAKTYDERLKREGKAHEKADAAFTKQYAEKARHEKAVRAAIIEHHAIKGMMTGEVQSALGPADETLPDGSWRYLKDGQRITVRFDDGQVSSVNATSGKKRK